MIAVLILYPQTILVHPGLRGVSLLNFLEPEAVADWSGRRSA
jgi:hypothetical protein